MNHFVRFFRRCLIVLVLGVAFHSTAALAQSVPPPAAPAAPIDVNANPQAKANFDDVLNEYHSTAAAWQNALGGYALRLFWLLAFIELVWASIRLVLRGADLQEWATELVKYVLFVGFFSALLFNAPIWANDIIQSFQQAAVVASAAGGHAASAVSPSDIFASGLNIAAQLDHQASGWHPVRALGIFIAALIIVILFAAIATMIVLAWIETYFVIYASIFFTGFGGSRFTSDYAKRVLMLAVTAGAKLFVLLLLAGLLQTLAQKWAQAAQSGTDPAVMGLVGLSILGAFLCVRIPSMIGSITSGQVASSSGLIAAAASLATAAAGLGVAAKGLQVAGKGFVKGAQAVHGTGMAVSAASSLASAQGAGGPKGLAGGMAHVGRTVANLGQSAVQNLGGPLSGRSALSARSANDGKGNLGSRMADSMTAKKAELTKPSAPPSPPAPPSGASGDSVDATPPAGGDGGDAPGTRSISGDGGAPSEGTGDTSAPSDGTGTGAPAASSGGSGTGDTPRNESPQGREKRSEFQEALRQFGNRIKAHNTSD